MSQVSFSAHINSSTMLLPAIQAWKLYLRDQGRSVHTLKAFVADLSLLASYLTPDKTVGQISNADLENYLNWLSKERKVPCSEKTLSRRITSLKSFFRWLNKNGAIPTDPAEKVIQKTVTSPLPQVLTKAEAAKALDAADGLRTSAKSDHRPYVLLKLVLETALKKGECLSLFTNHLELDGPEGGIVHVRYNSTSKHYKERKVTVSPEWVEAYKQYAELYQIKDQVFPWSQRRLEYLLEDVTNAAKLDKHISFDMCRWTSAVSDLLDGVESNTIRQKLGISKIQWREVYNKLKNLASEQATAIAN
jgi:integrase/recombinase XerD